MRLSDAIKRHFLLRNQAPNLKAVAVRAGLSREGLYRGSKDPRGETKERLARVLGVDVATIEAWLKEPEGE
jgi:DNA-binding phage protein